MHTYLCEYKVTGEASFEEERLHLTMVITPTIRNGRVMKMNAKYLSLRMLLPSRISRRGRVGWVHVVSRR